MIKIPMIMIMMMMDDDYDDDNYADDSDDENNDYDDNDDDDNDDDSNDDIDDADDNNDDNLAGPLHQTAFLGDERVLPLRPQLHLAQGGLDAPQDGLVLLPEQEDLLSQHFH